MMNIEFLSDYVVVVILGICLCVGYILKHSFPKFDNRKIPLVMAILGIVLNVWINLSISATIILGGLVSGLASTGLHQTFTKFLNKEGD